MKSYRRIMFQGYSMYPSVRPGDELILALTGSPCLGPGDIVCMPLRGGLVVHRIVEITGEGRKAVIITKGDNLPRPDPPIVLSKGPILKVVMISRGGKAPFRPRLGRVLAALSRSNLTYGIIKRKIGRGLRGAYKPCFDGRSRNP